MALVSIFYRKKRKETEMSAEFLADKYIFQLNSAVYFVI